MIKSEKVENRQTTQVLPLFCFFHQNILFFFLSIFFYKSQTPLTCFFLISHQFLLITGRYFHHRHFHWFLLDFLSRDTHNSQESRGRGRPFLTLHYYFHLLHEHLHIGLVITAESSPLHIATTSNQIGNFCFLRASR